ncbi:ABC transporter substrate-binding protein [Aeromicrobium alkaliterrae]
MSFLSACGNSDEETTESGLTKITVLRSLSSGFEPLYLAEQAGCFEENGLEVTIKPGAGDTAQNIPSVLRGDAQFAITGSTGVINAAAEGLPVRAVSGLVSSPTDDPEQPRVSGVLVPADSPIQDITDLEGKTIGVTAAAGYSDLMIRWGIAEAGGDPQDVDVAALPMTSLVEAAQTGQVDAIGVFEPFMSAGLGAGMREVRGADISDHPGLVGTLIFSSDEYLKEHADTAEALVKALECGTEVANEDQDALHAVQREYTEVPDDFINNQAPLKHWTVNIDGDLFEEQASFMEELGFIANAPDADEMLWKNAPRP